MLIPHKKVVETLQRHGIRIEGILHVGAHDCEELGAYEAQGTKRNDIVWLEAMRDKVEQNTARGIPNVFKAVVDEHAGQSVTFNKTNNGQSSSILELAVHRDFYPQIFVVDRTNEITTTIDDVLREKLGNRKTRRLNFWNLDIQGAELRALKGAKQSLAWVDAIYCEVNAQELYKGCCLQEQLSNFLASIGFALVDQQMTNQGWGDALYVRRRLTEIPQDCLNDCDCDRNGEVRFAKFLRDAGLLNNCVIDVGAGSNAFFADLVSGHCSVHLFEPHPKAFAELAQKIGKRRNVTVHNVALGQSEANLTYYERCQSFVDRPVNQDGSNQTLELPVIALDDVEPLYQEKTIDLIKLDVEGFEFDVFCGASKALAKTQVVQFEYGGTYVDRQVTLQQVFDMLRKHGFQHLYVLHADRHLPVNVDQPLHEHYQYSNYVATRQRLALYSHTPQICDQQ